MFQITLLGDRMWKIVCLLFIPTVIGEYEWKHHNNFELKEILEEIQRKCPLITNVYTLSMPSVRGVPLYVIEFSSNPGFHQLCNYFFLSNKFEYVF